MVSVSASQDMVDLDVTSANQVIGAIQTANHAAAVTPEVRLASAHPTENVLACPTSPDVLVTSVHPAISNIQNASVSYLVDKCLNREKNLFTLRNFSNQAAIAIHRDPSEFLVITKGVVNVVAILTDIDVITVAKDFTTTPLAKVMFKKILNCYPNCE